MLKARARIDYIDITNSQNSLNFKSKNVAKQCPKYFDIYRIFILVRLLILLIMEDLSGYEVDIFSDERCLKKKINILHDDVARAGKNRSYEVACP